MKKYRSYLCLTFAGGATPTMIEQGETLEDYLTNSMDSIIIGEYPIDEFDKIVEEWRKRGGDQITKEVNEWYKSVK